MNLEAWLASDPRLLSFDILSAPQKGRIEWADIAPEAKPLLVAALWQRMPRQMVVVCPTHERATQWQARLSICGIPEKCIALLPSALGTVFEDAPPEASAIADRIRTLKALAKGEPVCVIATGGAALERTLTREQVQSSALTFGVTSEIEIPGLLSKLGKIGYEYQDPVRLPGQYARRGGIVDVFPMDAPFPIRLEFFGDVIEEIREFDPGTQRSIRDIRSIDVPPARETLLPASETLKQLTANLRERLAAERADLMPEAQVTLDDHVSADVAAFEQGVYFDRLDLYRPQINALMGREPATALSYLRDDGLVVLDEPIELGGQVDRALEDVRHVLESRQRRGEMLEQKVEEYSASLVGLSAHTNVIGLNSMSGPVEWFAPRERIEVGASSLSMYRGQPVALVDAMRNWLHGGVMVIIGTDQPHRASQMLSDLEIPNLEVTDDTPGAAAAGQAALVHGNLAGGFVMPAAKFAFVTDTELFGVARLRMPARRVHEGVPIASLLDLKVGDYVVHIHQGIGVFRGLTKMEREGALKEYLVIDYAPPDRIYVPVEQIDRVQKYLAPGEEKPQVMRLGGGEWARSLRSAKEGAKQLAGELTRLYAARQKATRPPYSPDSPWQQEMEAAFPYVETPSQALAIRDVKEDMEEAIPMDRLVCGDVGFGKTEVAVRAAFKALQDNRQVAVLCPTTILAAQHVETFNERLASYPLRIDLLNRYRSPKEQKATIAALAEGTVDIVIGTHRLLSKDVKFKNLGVLIIDEEQRFGVAHKERLKQLRTQVDVLTLTATPIPRTLYMGLMDIREMSVINDPPPGRMSIRTYVRTWDDEAIRDAILRELQRDGQVFLVHNRIDSIYHVADRLTRLLPYARIAVAHGQMDEKELEQVMIAFHARQYDILLSTTIIENGLDMPNVNTIIVDQAHRLGLSQLYQLRGRVGRSDRQAYAYFTYRAGMRLNDSAYDRLQALREFSQLGSGFSLAMRDLQIRGAGELLGARQHGAMASVGFELYMQLVSEAVHEIQGTPLDDTAFPSLPTVDIPVSALIPPDYIEDGGQRLYYYKRIGALANEAAMNDLMAEMKDRYGDLPRPLRTAFLIVGLRLYCRQSGIQKIEERHGSVKLWLKSDTKLSQRSVYQLQAAFRDYRFSPDGAEAQYRDSALSRSESKLFDELHKLVSALHEAVVSQGRPTVQPA